MLEKIVIKNFQSHRKLEVDLDPKVTTIVGPSDVGKSAVIRALVWLCSNQPSGTEFRTEGEDEVRVSLTVDGKTIERNRSDTVNTYSLESTIFKSFGQKVPNEIVDFLNLDDINFQQQHDSPFWLSLPAGQVSQKLNALVDLSIIDESIKKISSTVSKEKTRCEIIEENHLKKSKELSNLNWVTACGLDLDVLKCEETKMDKSADALAAVVSAAGVAAAAKENADTLAAAVSAVGEVGRAAQHTRKTAQVLLGVAGCVVAIERAQQSMRCLDMDIGPVAEARLKFEENTKLLNRLLRDVQSVESIRFVDPKCLKNLDQVLGAISTLKRTQNEFAELEHDVDYAGSLLVDITKRRKAALDVDTDILNKTEGRCPICRGPL